MQSAAGMDADESASSATTDPAATATGELTVEDSEDIKHSPPVLVDEFDTETGTITLKMFGQRLWHKYSEFRVDHCGWESPTDSSTSVVDDEHKHKPVKERKPVEIKPGEIYMLDPMVDDFGSPKADTALESQTIGHNVLWQHLKAIQNGEATQHNGEAVVDPQAVEAFLETVVESEQCLNLNDDQLSVIQKVNTPLVPLQGPSGTGKTSGATAPALLARAYARAEHDESFVGIVVAPSHNAVDEVLDGTTTFLDGWRQTEDGLEALQMTRILSATPPAAADRVDDTTSAVDVTYANYRSSEGEATLAAVADDIFESATQSTDTSQHLLFTTPTTLYHTLRIIAKTQSAIDGDGAKDAMQHSAGLADVVCVDEASMMDLPQWLLAGSTLKPTGQTLLVGDHRQLPTVTETDWIDTLRKPLTETNAYLSALEYVYWLYDLVSDDRADDGGPDLETGGGHDSGTDGRTAGATAGGSGRTTRQANNEEVDDSSPPASTDSGSPQTATQQCPTVEAATRQSAFSHFSSPTQQPNQHDGSDEVTDSGHPAIQLEQLTESHRFDSELAALLTRFQYHKDNITLSAANPRPLPASAYTAQTPGLEAVFGSSSSLVFVCYDDQSHQMVNPIETAISAALAEAVSQTPTTPPATPDGGVVNPGEQTLPDAGSDEQPVEATQSTAGEQSAPSFGVVTPHNAQRGALDKRLGEEMTANTVEKYQGDERDIIAVSATVSDPEFARREERFILNPNRLLVAISRSRLLTVVVCSTSLFEVAPKDSEDLDGGPVWARLFSQAVGREATPAWVGSLAEFVGHPVDEHAELPVRVYPSIGSGLEEG